jgi:hypothetical protein
MALFFTAFMGMLGASAALAEPGSNPANIEFNRDIRPILSDNCFTCHGPDSGQRKARLRLDDRDVAIERAAIVPGKPDQSELIARIYATSDDDLMPPPETTKQLSAAQKDLLKRWILDGAEYQPHWAYIAPARPEPPVPSKKGWVKSPVDAFILRELEARNIQPSPEADRRTLLRRLSLDLTGLPPTPEEVAAFLADEDSRAYEKQVERLLASHHYGERMAAPWLDAVRFADTVGYHGDQNQNIFPYRDYIIDSFNQNKPFDQFTIEQLAGDLLPNPTIEQRVATGFNRLNMMTREGGAQPQEYLAKYAADRVRAVSTAWLGSTMACAECHDHKFDPFSAKDFYSLAAFFADVKQWGVYSDYVYTPNPDLKDFTNDHPFPPELEVESPYLQRRRDALSERILELQHGSIQTSEESESTNGFSQWRDAARVFLSNHASGWASPKPSLDVSELTTDDPPKTNYIVRADSSVLFIARGVSTNQITVQPPAGWIAALRIEVLPDPEHGGRIVQRGARSASIQLRGTLKPAEGKEVKLAFHHADADRKEIRYAHGAEIIGVRDQWRLSRELFDLPQTAIYFLDKPLRATEGDSLQLTLRADNLWAVRISVSPIAPIESPGVPSREEIVEALLDPGELPPLREQMLQRVYFASTGLDSKAFAEYKTLHRRWLETRNGRAFTLVTEAVEPMVTRVLPRGNWQDESGEVVEPATPHFLPGATSAESNRLTRLDLARWIVAPENPLTARTIVNRLWEQFFGTGLCATVDDLGLQGEMPSHPELLDWLAVEFRESGWDIKHIVRQIVLSSSYRQSSNLRPELREIDPANRLLASQNPRRLEAEFVRDNALFISGLFNRAIGGPSARPYQPAGYYGNLQFPDRDYVASPDEEQYRRGVYMHWQRTFLHPMLANFDASSREECAANRIVSNTPQQALTLLNDPSFVEAARVFAANLLRAEARSDEARLARAFEKTLARPVKSSEQAPLLLFLEKQREHYRSAPEDAEKLLKVGLAPAPVDIEPAELAAWTSVCRVILNLHETITRY